MLKILVPGCELFDPMTGTFSYTKDTVLALEHSLVSLSKWESKWKKPFLNKEHTQAEFDDYVRCMTITQNVNPSVYGAMHANIRNRIMEYMDDSMTAAVIHDEQTNRQNSPKFITSDLIYSWMVALRIPFECQKWHINRLLTLIHIIDIDRRQSNKMSKSDSARSQQAINAARRAKMKKRK